MTNQARTNGDPGGEDQFDGGCPSDTVRAQIVPAPAPERAIYARLVVWKDGNTDLYTPGKGSLAAAQAAVDEWNGEPHHGRAFVVRIPVPEYPK